MTRLKTTLFLFAILYNITLLAQNREPQVAQQEQTFSLGADDLGSVANSVNLFTGEVALPMEVVSLPSRGGLDAGISFSYSSAEVRQQATTWNLEAPTGVLGMGWKLDYPRILVDHKETGAIEDDEYYLVEGGVSNRLYRGEGSTNFREYHTANYRFWKIIYEPDDERWEITKEDGTLYVFGDENSTRNTIQWGVRWDNWVGNSSRTFVNAQSQQAIVWNLSEVKNTWGDTVTYEYDQVENYVGSTDGQKQTEASYLTKITTPSGGQVRLHYYVKLADEYMEPHTEQVEPDAYQERYEKKYLDHIEVWSDFGQKLRTVRMAYGFVGSGDLTKRVLTSIIPEDAQGQSLPGTQFEYLNSGTSIGCMERVINHWGGWVKFTYSDGITVSNSKRDIAITAPTGYAEPNVWQGNDYVVVSWRQLNAGNHEEGNRDLQLKVYQWVGEWKGQDLSTIPNVQHDVPASSSDHHRMDDFQLATSKEFFAVLKKKYSANLYDLYIYHKSELERVKWTSDVYSLNVDPGYSLDDLHQPSLLVGENFVAVHTKMQGDIFTYTWDGSGWISETLTDLSLSRYEAGSGNNWFISHSRSGTDKSYLRYLNEQKKWVNKEFSSSVTWEADFDQPTTWWGANSFVVAMATDNNGESYAYTWDQNYSSFSEANLGSIANISNPVAIAGNSLVGIPTGLAGYQFFARFDGDNWHTTQNKQGYYYTTGDYYFGFTDDVVSWANPTGNNGWQKVFDPNDLVWDADQSLTGLSGTLHEAQMVGRNVNYLGGRFHYKEPNGSWTVLDNVSGQLAITAGAPNFSLYDRMNDLVIPKRNSYILQIKNGMLDVDVDEIQVEFAYQVPVGTSGFLPYRQLTGLNTIVLAPVVTSGVYYWEDLNELQIHRLVDDALVGDQVFYPIVLVETNDGEQSYYTSYDYNADNALQTATASPDGLTAHFSMVRMIPGSNTTLSTPYGYIETYFFNGLASGDSYKAFPSGGNAETAYKKLLGMSYGSTTYNSNQNEVASSETTYNVITKTIGNGTKNVANVHYVRPISATQLVDGLTTSTTNTYDPNTGMLATSTTSDLSGNGEDIEVTYKYWWEEYNTNRSKNILNGVIMEQIEINSVLTDISVTTWKNWNPYADAPWQTFRWKGTGTGAFSGWSSGVGGTDWVKTTQVEERDSYGNVLETSNIAGLSNAVVMGYHHTTPVAQISNADYSTVKTALGGDTGINNLQTQDGTTLQNTLNALRTDNNLSEALVTTSTYHPLNGLITSIDPNGQEISNDFNDAFLLTSIKDDDDNIVAHSDYHFTLSSSAPQLSVSSNDINPDDDAGSTVLTVTSNGDWTTNNHGSGWLSVTPANGTNNANITISYSQNGSTESRPGTITVTGQGLSEDITVNQDGKTIILTTSTHELVFNHPTIDLDFDITSNVSWSIAMPPTYYDDYGWIFVSSTSGTGDKTITVSIIDNNLDPGTYEGELTITGGGITRTVDITFIKP